jgi:hypothetical protein
MSRLIARRNEKKATILRSKRTVEDAIQRANSLAQAWMNENPNDPRLDELERVVSHLSSVLKKTPQEMRAEGATSIEDYFDDAKMPESANTIKREVDMIAKWNNQQRPAAQGVPGEKGVGYVPDTAVAQRGIHASKKQADGGAAFTTDRDDKSDPKSPEQVEVPRVAAKKKEAVPEAPAPAAPVPTAPASGAAGGGAVNPIDYIPTDILIKIIGDLPKEEDFPQNQGKQDAVIELTNILKSRPVEPPEPAEGAAPAAPAAAAPVAAPVASKKKADLGGLSIASSVDEEGKTADYRLHDYKLEDEGVRPSGKLPSMEEQEQRMHVEDEENPELIEASMDKEAVSPSGWSGTTEHMKKHKEIDNPWALSWYMKNKGDSPHYKESGDEPDTADRRMAALEVWKERQASMYKELASKYASGAAGGGWSTDIGEKGRVVEDGGNLADVDEAHAALDESGARLNRPVTTNPIQLNKQAAEMTATKAVKEAERLGNELKKMYLDAKSLTQVNDTRPVREAVESIFRAADMFDEATKALNKQQQQEESEREAAAIKEKNKKSSLKSPLFSLSVAASE